MAEGGSLSEREVRKLRNLLRTDAEREILLKMHEEERAVEGAVRQYYTSYYLPTTWVPVFDRAKRAAIERFKEFMEEIDVAVETTRTKNEELEERLGKIKLDVEQRHKVLKDLVMASLRNEMNENFFVLRVKEELANALKKCKIPDELSEDEDIKKLKAELLEKFIRRRTGLIVGAGIASGSFVGVKVLAVTFGVGAAAGVAAGASVGSVVAVVILVVGGCLVYAFWDKVEGWLGKKQFEMKERLEKFFAERKNFDETAEKENLKMLPHHAYVTKPKIIVS